MLANRTTRPRVTCSVSASVSGRAGPARVQTETHSTVTRSFPPHVNVTRYKPPPPPEPQHRHGRPPTPAPRAVVTPPLPVFVLCSCPRPPLPPFPRARPVGASQANKTGAARTTRACGQALASESPRSTSPTYPTPPYPAAATQRGSRARRGREEGEEDPASGWPAAQARRSTEREFPRSRTRIPARAASGQVPSRTTPMTPTCPDSCRWQSLPSSFFIIGDWLTHLTGGERGDTTGAATRTWPLLPVPNDLLLIFVRMYVRTGNDRPPVTFGRGEQAIARDICLFFLVSVTIPTAQYYYYCAAQHGHGRPPNKRGGSHQ